MSITATAPPSTATSATELSLARLHLMRAGYLLMGVGLVLVKWPLLPDAHSLPLYEGVTLCLLTAMSLLAFLGLLHPVKLLPLLLFESAWKLLWLSLVALPRAISGDLDAATTRSWSTARSSCSSSPSSRGATCGAPSFAPQRNGGAEPAGCLALSTWGSRMTRRTGPRGFSADQQLVK